MSVSRIYIYTCKVCNGKVSKPPLTRDPKWAQMDATKFLGGLGKWKCENGHKSGVNRQIKST